MSARARPLPGPISPGGQGSAALALLGLLRGETLPEAQAAEALSLAGQHGLLPLLHQLSQDEPPLASVAGLAPAVRAGLRRARAAELLCEQERQRALHRALEALRRPRDGKQVYEIPVLLLKGASSARTIYPAPELRPRADLDLLVRPADRVEALARLAASGYARHPRTRGTPEDDDDWHERTLTHPSAPDHQLDLHFALAQRQRHRLDAARLFATSEPWPAAGEAARILRWEEACLVCAHSIAIHELAVPLIALADLARLLERSDLRRLHGLAREVRLLRALFVSVRLLLDLAGPRARSFLGAPLDPAALLRLLEQIGLSRPTRTLLARAASRYSLARASPSRLEQLARKALFIDRPRDVARFASAHALRWLRRRSG